MNPLKNPFQIPEEEVAKYRAAGFTVAFFVDLPGHLAQQLMPPPSVKRRRFTGTRAKSSNDNSVYKFTSKAPSFKKGTQAARVWKQLANLFRGTESQRRYRHQITTYLKQHLSLSHKTAITAINYQVAVGVLLLEKI